MTQDVEKRDALSKNFGDAWGRLAHEFLDPNNIAEYNALKHGNRVLPGGFTLSMGLEEEYGKPAPREATNVMTHSKWGSTFYRIERFGGEDKANRSVRSVRHSVNWNVWNTAAATQLLAMSTRNVISTIQISNGSDPATVKFYLVDEEDFRKPWAVSVGLLDHASFDLVMDDDPRYHSTAQQLNDVFVRDES